MLELTLCACCWKAYRTLSSGTQRGRYDGRFRAAEHRVLRYIREEDGSPHVEKNYIGTPPLISERADIILILKSRGPVSSEKRQPLSRPAAQKEKWPSDLIYERTNEHNATLDCSSLMLVPLSLLWFSSPLASLRHWRDSFLLAEFATTATASSNPGPFLGKSRDKPALPRDIKSRGAWDVISLQFSFWWIPCLSTVPKLDVTFYTWMRIYPRIREFIVPFIEHWM